MSVLSPHLREQAFGRRVVCYTLQDVKIVAPPPNSENSSELALRAADGSIELVDAEKWTVSQTEGDIITLVMLSPLKGKRTFLASLINRTRRERQHLSPLSTLLRNARVSRGLGWWLSFLFLAAAAFITETGLSAQLFSKHLEFVENYTSGQMASVFNFFSHPLDNVFNWLSTTLLPIWPSQTSSSFGSLQDHGAIALIAIIMMIIILLSRNMRPLTVALLVTCLFVLKIRLFGFGSAQGSVLLWYAPLLALLVLTGAINRLRDQWRMNIRLSAICKSQLSQPLPESMIIKESPPPPHLGMNGNNTLNGIDLPELDEQPAKTPDKTGNMIYRGNSDDLTSHF